MQLDFDIARANMVESQVRTNDVSDIELISAISNTRREVFVRDNEKSFAYSEINVTSLSGRALLKPRDFSKLSQALNIGSNDEVLIIAGSGGYSAAVLALLAKKVTVFDDVDANAEVYEYIKGDLETLDGLDGRQFDVVMVDQGVEIIPDAWLGALKDNGRMGIIQSNGIIGQACLFIKAAGYLSKRALFETSVPVLAQFNSAPEFEF